MELMEVSLGTIFLSETVGSTLLLLLGVGVVANTLLKDSKGQGTGWLLINWGWGIGVFTGVIAAYNSGGHLNPAVTVGVIASGAEEFVPGVAVNFASTMTYFGGELLGAMIGATLAWLAYKDHFDAEEDQGAILGCFSTGPGIRNPLMNTITEAIATFVLVFGVMASSNFTASQGGEGAVNLGWLGALGVALLVFGIGASLGGPTGYAINPTRDLGPRIMHAILPIKGKGGSDWGYSWVPIVGPLIGGAIAGLVSVPLLP